MELIFDNLTVQKQCELLDVLNLKYSVIAYGIKGTIDYDQALKEAREKYREVDIGHSEWLYGPYVIFFREHREYYYCKYRDGDKPPINDEYRMYHDLILKLTPPMYFIYNHLDDEEWDILKKIINAKGQETIIEVGKKLTSYKGLFLQLFAWDNPEEMLGDRDTLVLDFPDGRSVRLLHKK